MKHERCPSKDELIRFFEEGTAEGRDRKLLTHVLSCPECLTILETTREIHSQSEAILDGLRGLDLTSRETRDRLRREARREVSRLAASRRAKKPAFLRWVGIPAVGAAVVCLTLWVVIPSLKSHRRGDMERNASATEIALVQPRGTIARDGLTFKWTSGPDVRSCRLEIYDRGLEPVYQSGPLDASAYSLPEGALAGIRKDEVYFWKVVATLKDEQPVESEFAKFIAH